MKRRYKRFATQENPSKQLKSYHLKQLGTTAASSIEYEPSLAQRSHEYHDSDNKDSTDDEHDNTNANEQHGDQTDTSSDELSASTSSESISISDSESTDDENEAGSSMSKLTAKVKLLAVNHKRSHSMKVAKYPKCWPLSLLFHLFSSTI